MENYYPAPALVLGLHINGLGVIRSLAEDKRIKIIGVGKDDSIGSGSKYLFEKYLYEKKDEQKIVDILRQISSKYEKVIVFPTGSDYWVRILSKNKDRFTNFVNIYDENIDKVMKKPFQHKIAKELEIPIPKSIKVDDLSHLETIKKELKRPYLVKPSSRNTDKEAFRIKEINNYENLSKILYKHLSNGQSFMISEIIPGKDSALYTYGTYAWKGKVYAQFFGRKLTQMPSNYGVIGTGESLTRIPEIENYGKKILNYLNFSGVSQIEFKYDVRDKKYKLIEINPRSWMWEYLSTKVGVNLSLVKYYNEALDLKKEFSQHDKKKYFILGHSLFYNLFKEGKLFGFIILFRGMFTMKATFSTISINDPKPITKVFKRLVKAFIKRLTKLFSKN